MGHKKVLAFGVDESMTLTIPQHLTEGYVMSAIPIHDAEVIDATDATDATDTHNAPEGKETKPEAEKRLPMRLDDRGLYIVRDQAEECRIAHMLISTGAVNKTLNSASKVVMAMQAAKSLNLNPYTALRQMAFINNCLTFYGDLELAVVRMAGQLEGIEEFKFCLNEDGKYERRCFANSNLHLPAYGAVCRVKRRGHDWAEEAFTEADAQKANLWGKTPTWKQYPDRMLQMRARGLALRNNFSDATQGLSTIEYDHEGIDYGKKGQEISHMAPA
ncbi:MAG: hypothetical protein EOO38_10685 [Cytophagaceae bacterium]|nr:MAG: hypothetical protein EOO38_10685 [Cytophagaceae bacterium]